MKFVHPKTKAVIESNDENVYNVFIRAGFKEVKESKDKDKDKEKEE